MAETIKMNDKRQVVDITPKVDPVDAFIIKVFSYITEQPEFFTILGMDRATRKRLEKAIVKSMTRFPHFAKLGR